jgi:hypothetical protein
VARPFYVLCHSFTKHVVDDVGLESVVRLLVENDTAAFERRSGRTESDLRNDWLARFA